MNVGKDVKSLMIGKKQKLFHYLKKEIDHPAKITENYILNTSYKVYSKILTNRLKVITDKLLLEEQSGFRQGRSCIDDVFTLKQITEKRREFNLETHLAFIDYNKAFDHVDRNKLWNIMQQTGYPTHLIQAIQSLYDETKVIIQSGDQITEEIKTNQGVKHGCSLSPTLFNIYIDNMIRRWKAEIKTGIKLNDRLCLNTMLFADDQATMWTLNLKNSKIYVV
jgi:hypothetical protein